VTVHTVHQHNAPIADTDAERLLRMTSNPPTHLDLDFIERATDQLATAVGKACQRLEPFTQVGFGQARVERFAANRRVRLADGAIHVRYSATKDPALQAAPEGLIDPWLRTITFLDRSRPLVRLHYYATHPMSHYGDGRATSDTVGLARRRLEESEGVPQIYFTGCGGNITAGKYNDGSPETRVALTDRILAAMKAAVAASETHPATRLDWQTTRIKFHPRTAPEWSEAKAEADLGNTNAAATTRLKAAFDLAWLNRLRADPRVEISRLSVGPVTSLHLPGEAFIEYQLYAQSLRPDEFVAVAAYGEGGPGYICCDASLSEGGYEPTMSRVGPPSEFDLKAGIARLLAPVAPARAWFQPDKQHVLLQRDTRGRETPIRTRADWERRRDEIRAAMILVMGAPPAGKAKRTGAFEIVTEERLPQFTRKRINFGSPDGDAVPAWLFVPHQLAGKAPAMLCFHQTTPSGKGEPAGRSGSPDLHYARELAERGFVTLAPDYPIFGDYRVDAYALGYASTTMKGVVNHRAAVDVLAGLPEVDARRIGVIGHSLGGHNALFLAAFDPRVKAVVTSCGFNSFFKYQGGDLTGWSHAGYMPRIASEYGCDPRRMPFDFTEVLAAVAPRPVFISAPQHDDNFELSGVQDCVIAARPVYELYRATDALVLETPEGGHDFPQATRVRAYDWLERALGVVAK
jgi:pimeloyl-ACP methyl ester carboxylesterase